MRYWLERFLARFRRQRELHEEVEFHLQMRAELNRQDGLSEVDAADRALRQFGNRTSILEDMRAAHANRHLDATAQDFKYAVRGLGRSPGFAVVAILTLALGIGANTSIFSVVHTLIFQPLPYEGSERLVRVSEYRIGAISGVEQRWTAIPTYEFRAIAAQTRTLSNIAAYATVTMTLTGIDVPLRLAGASVSPSLFELLGVRPIVGRVFEPEEGELPAGPVVVVSQRLWEQYLSANPDVLGRAMILDDGTTPVTYTIIGVMPRELAFPDREVDFWIPLKAFAAPASRQPGAADPRTLIASVIAGLREGIALDAGAADTTSILQQFYDDHPVAALDIGSEQGKRTGGRSAAARRTGSVTRGTGRSRASGFARVDGSRRSGSADCVRQRG